MLNSYLKLCLFKSDPMVLIPTRTFSRNVIIFYLLSGFIVEGLIADFFEGPIEVIMRTMMAFSSVALFLVFQKNIFLFQRIFTAIFVCENVIMTLAVLVEVLDFWLITLHYEYHEWVGIGLATFLISWYLAIVAYILRRFFTFSVTKSTILAFSYFVLTYGIPMFIMDV